MVSSWRTSDSFKNRGISSPDARSMLETSLKGPDFTDNPTRRAPVMGVRQSVYNRRIAQKIRVQLRHAQTITVIAPAVIASLALVSGGRSVGCHRQQRQGAHRDRHAEHCQDGKWQAARLAS